MERNPSRLKICAIIPAYNESKTIGAVVRKTRKYVDRIFVIDDGSTDDTGEIARQGGAEVIRNDTNKGIGPALQSGYDVVTRDGADIIVQLDSDNQHDPRYIPDMLHIIKDCDVVIGSRFLNSSHHQYPLVRRLGISFFTGLVNLLVRTKVTDVTSGYRMFRTQVLRQMTPLARRHWAVEQTLEIGKAHLKIKEVSIEMPTRDTGRSQFSMTRYALYPLRMTWIIIRVMVFEPVLKRMR